MKLRCPFCKAKDQRPTNRKSIYCPSCKREWSDPNEGGDYSNFNPSARLEREERNAGRFKPKRML